MVFGKRRQKSIHRRFGTDLFVGNVQEQHSRFKYNIMARRSDVDFIWQKGLSVFYLGDVHRSGARQKRGEQTVMFRIHMLNNDISNIFLIRQRGQHLLESFKASGRRADSSN